MNGMNKTIISVVSTIALIYSALCFGLTLDHFVRTGGEEMKMYLFFPYGGELGFDLSQYIDVVFQYYRDVIASIIGFLPANKIAYIVGLMLITFGFIIPIMGIMTNTAKDCAGKTNPAEYLWTHRPLAILKCLALPWDLIPAMYRRSKPLVIIPVILLPLYIPWAIMIMVCLILPFIFAWIVVSIKISSKAKKEKLLYNVNTEYCICPHCKSKFTRPIVKCRCGLILDYPVPNKYGYKYHTCNRGHEIPCESGKRANLTTLCPNCKTVINNREAHPHVISMVGAVGSGKTTMMLAAVSNIKQSARSIDITVDAPSPGLKKELIDIKDSVQSTPFGEVDSECFFIGSRTFNTREILINDISGLEFQANPDKTIFQEYYRYSDGIIFAFDPMALNREIKKDTPIEIFDSFYYMYSSVNNCSPSTKSKTPIAIVSTRKDLTSPILEDGDVRQYLVDKGQEAFVKSIESAFGDISYFSVQSTGYECEGSVKPFWWILEKCDPELVNTIKIV